MWQKHRKTLLWSLAAGMSGLGTAAVLCMLGIAADPNSGLRRATPFPPKPAPQQGPADTVHEVAKPNDAMLAAFTDAQAIAAQGGAADLPYLWWIWIRSGEDEDAAVVNWTLNKVSQSPFLEASPVLRYHVGAVDVLMVRADLRTYWPQPDALAEALKIRDDFQFDPAFSLLITQDTLRLLNVGDLPRVKKTVEHKVQRVKGKRDRVTRERWPGGVDDTGKYFPPGVEYDHHELVDDVEETTEKKDVEVLATDTDDFAVLRLNSKAIAKEEFLRLQEVTHTQAPVVSDRYFNSRAQSTIKDDKVSQVFATIYGGRYYDLAGIKRSKDPKKTDLTVFLESLGVIDAEKTFDRLRSDQRVVQHSDVTDKDREVDIFHTLAGRPENGTGLIGITRDFHDASIDIGQNPYMNLVKVKVDAFEVRAEKPNGLIADSIFDGAEKLLDEAGADIVAAHNHRNPHTTRLAPPDCEICHGDADGWKDLRNDIKKLLDNGFTPFGDLTQVERTLPDIRDRLRGWYAGELDLPLQRAKDDQARAFLRTGGGFLWKEDIGQRNTVRMVTQRFDFGYESFNYGTVDAADACADLGIHVPQGETAMWNGKKTPLAVAVFNMLLPPDPDSRIGLDYPEDVRIALLKSGVKVGVKDWQQVESFAAARSQKTLARVLQNPPKN